MPREKRYHDEWHSSTHIRKRSPGIVMLADDRDESAERSKAWPLQASMRPSASLYIKDKHDGPASRAQSGEWALVAVESLRPHGDA